MNEPLLYATATLAALAAVAMLTAAGLTGWRDWLALKRHELGLRGEATAASSGIGTRIEIADLKERIRKLEAIAAGVDL